MLKAVSGYNWSTKQGIKISTFMPLAPKGEFKPKSLKGFKKNDK
jgi:hypothetical protein